MTNIATIPEQRRAASGFYPTPASMASKMLEGIKWDYVSTILEPSAGKGNLAEAINEKWRIYRSSRRYYAEEQRADIDCIEVDPNLRAILKEKKFRVVHDDFLTYKTMKRYSLIIMNPPFEDAARHILKAISLLDANGTLVALCNAETIRNHSAYNERYQLFRFLTDNNAEITYHQGEFMKAERKTDVEIAMIRYKAPAADLGDSLILEKLRPAHKYVAMQESEYAALSKSDFVEAIIDRYNYEVESGLRLIQEYRAVSSVLSSSMSLTIGTESAYEDRWIRECRHKYWSTLFASPQFIEQLTTNLRTQLYNRVKELEDYEFSFYNIKEIMIQMNTQITQGVEATIMALFDDWTRKYHWDENAQNRHYFDGWRTNDAFAVNKKVILPLRGYTDWGSRIEPEFHVYNVREKLMDIEKVFNYLDGGRTPEKNLTDVLEEAEKTGETKKLDSKYFYLTFYKKGTAHLEFKDMNLLARFNIFAARGKNWLPPSFGKKKYRDMTAEEQNVAKSFMGTADRYDKVVQHANYFLAPLSDSSQLKIVG